MMCAFGLGIGDFFACKSMMRFKVKKGLIKLTIFYMCATMFVLSLSLFLSDLIYNFQYFLIHGQIVQEDAIGVLELRVRADHH
jgi:hypothetical protein